MTLDISNFFNSIYSHSLSWVFYGREMSYQYSKDPNKPGEFNILNNIDKLLMNSNDKKSNGILIGPL